MPVREVEQAERVHGFAVCGPAAQHQTISFF
jgi:hypothetical protein